MFNQFTFSLIFSDYFQKIKFDVMKVSRILKAWFPLGDKGDNCDTIIAIR